MQLEVDRRAKSLIHRCKNPESFNDLRRAEHIKHENEKLEHIIATLQTKMKTIE